ncbi:hypothetical protein SAMN04487770_1315 [Butyrivibrio sp. ob235]|uniref:hypothetical protein n=1 Tax=Butyrivibrio sp. ob235 TaxID=1761780 RepID=UPI0008D6C034|nr:hypothetical protein [Butyrivibrio sp. ob235]SEM25824.1 hypothetical protein SAMN04487770_1315 [Butyrivibrio sp. ob235]
MELDKYGKLNTAGDIRWVHYEDFKFDFLKEIESRIMIIPEDGFIKGNTLDGQFIYLHKEEPFEFEHNAVHFSTDAYIVGESLEVKKCKGIRFTGEYWDYFLFQTN